MSKSRRVAAPRRAWGVRGESGNRSGSAGSAYWKSRPRKYSPETLNAAFCPTRPAWRSAPRKIERSPPSTVALVPTELNGDLVITCSTPFAEFGPYSADAGPSRTSTRSMSSVVPVVSSGTFTRSDGTPANR
jgi:hypothetical protein